MSERSFDLRSARIFEVALADGIFRLTGVGEIWRVKIVLGACRYRMMCDGNPSVARGSLDLSIAQRDDWGKEIGGKTTLRSSVGSAAAASKSWFTPVRKRRNYDMISPMYRGISIYRSRESDGRASTMYQYQSGGGLLYETILSL